MVLGPGTLLSYLVVFLPSHFEGETSARAFERQEISVHRFPRRVGWTMLLVHRIAPLKSCSENLQWYTRSPIVC